MYVYVLFWVDNLIFSKVDDTYTSKSIVYVIWFLLANKILIITEAFDNQYGVDDDEDRPVVEFLGDLEEEGGAAASSARSDSLGEPLLK
jgi:hypothetical protein